MRASQVRQKLTYDVKTHQCSFDRGDLVYKLDTSTKKGESKKLKPVWIGPFVVTEVVSPVLYRIEGHRKASVVHHDQIKICNDRVVPFWIRRKRHYLLDLNEIIAYAVEELESTIDPPILPTVPAASDLDAVPAMSKTCPSIVTTVSELIVDIAFAAAEDKDLPAFDTKVQLPSLTSTRTREIKTS